MSRGKRLWMGLATCALLAIAVIARATDQPVSAVKLILKSINGKEKFIFISKDPGFLFPAINSNDDPANGSPGGAIVDILTRDGGNATFNVPPGQSLPPGWKVKDATIDLYKYINKDAPAGPVPIKVVVLKDTKVLKIVGKETGVPLSGTLGDVVIRVTTGTARNCARFDASTIKKDQPGQFIALGALASALPDCGSGPPTTVTTSTTSTSSSSSSSTSSSTSTSSSSTTSTSSSSTTTTSTSSSTTTSTSSTTTTSTSTSSTTTTSTSSSSTTSTSTSTTLPRTLSFITGPPTGICGSVRSGGTAGTIRKNLGCGGLNIGGGQSTVAEGPTPDNAETRMTATCAGPTCTVTARTAAQTGSNTNCSNTGCAFGPYLPIANAGTSTCVRNTFSSPASGTLNSTTGVFTGAFPLTSTVYLTANATSPCPLCLGGTPGVTNSGTCDAAWTSGAGPSPDAGAACTPVNSTGNSHDCDPPAAVVLPSFPVNLNPITTGTSFFFNAGGLFCPSQANSGAFGCAGSGAANAICPGGNSPPLIDYIAESGAPTGPVLSSPTATTLASTFCIPSVGGSLGFLINGAANLPGPGATSLPGTFALVP